MVLASFLLFPVVGLITADVLAFNGPILPPPPPADEVLTNGEKSPGTAPTIFTTGKQLVEFIVTIGNWIFYILLAAAGVFLIYAGVLFVTAAGDAQQITKARGILINGLIGVAIAALARGAVAVVESIFK